MYLNGQRIGNGWADEENTTGQRETFSWQWTLNLVAGDQIWLESWEMPTGTYLYGVYYTQFSGSLLEEKITVV